MRALRLLLVVTAILAADTASFATTRSVTVSDNVFTPRSLTALVGDTVSWTRLGAGGNHNVRQNSKIFYSGSPTVGPISYSRVFSAGIFHYYCEIHGSTSGGMDGYVRVPVRISSSPTGLPFTVRWATTTATGSTFDVQYRIGSSTTWRTWRSNTTSMLGTFGKSGAPVAVRDNVTYTFRARSRKVVSGTTKFSGYSPAKSFKP